MNIKKVFGKIIKGIERRITFWYCIVKSIVLKKNFKKYDVASIEDTISKIINDHVSVSRFGEGEFRWMNGENYASFEMYSEDMSLALKNAIKGDLKNYIVCISPCMAKVNTFQYTKEARRYFEYIVGKEGEKWHDFLDEKRAYYNADVTRFYMESKNKDNAGTLFNRIRAVWENRDILLVEGELTRFGVGNDLLKNANSIIRIVAPSVNAYGKYSKILDLVMKFGENRLILLALGPTASIMAYDLAKEGFWAIDIGHLDVEYEWYSRKVVKKEAIRGKYVNEAGGINSFIEFDGSELSEYNKEIVGKVI